MMSAPSSHCACRIVAAPAGQKRSQKTSNAMLLTAKSNSSAGTLDILHMLVGAVFRPQSA